MKMNTRECGPDKLYGYYTSFRWIHFQFKWFVKICGCLAAKPLPRLIFLTEVLRGEGDWIFLNISYSIFDMRMDCIG